VGRGEGEVRVWTEKEPWKVKKKQNGHIKAHKPGKGLKQKSWKKSEIHSRNKRGIMVRSPVLRAEQ